MFNFSTFISLFVAIIAIYIPLYFTFKKELDDLETNENSNKEKITNREEKITALKIVCFILAIALIILYQFPAITMFFKNIDLQNLEDNLEKIFYKILPFKEDFFSDPQFKFSFITGIILSIIIVIFVFCGLFAIIEPSKFYEFIIPIIISIILVIGLIWANNYISLFLVYCIKHYFEFLSMVLNIISYAIIAVFIFIILIFFEECFF